MARQVVCHVTNVLNNYASSRANKYGCILWIPLEYPRKSKYEKLTTIYSSKCTSQPIYPMSVMAYDL